MGKETLETDVYDDGRKEVNSQPFAEFLLDKIFELNQKFEMDKSNIELDVYYDTSNENKNELFVAGDPLTAVQDNAELESKGEALVRVGTIGTTDLSMWPIIRIVDKDLGVYEMDDGQGLKHHLEVYAQLDKWKMKRKFIDSSFGIEEDVRIFLKEYAVQFGWYDGLVSRLKNAVENPKSIDVDIKPKPIEP